MISSFASTSIRPPDKAPGEKKIKKHPKKKLKKAAK